MSGTAPFTDPIRILIVGQTPPPLTGQGMMIANILKISDPGIRLSLLRMDFSENMEEIGKFRLKKITSLIMLIIRVYLARIRLGSAILYYPPAGPNLLPMMRDMMILILCRPVFRRTVFHFHAGGLSTLYPELPFALRFLFRWAFFRPDATIRISALNPEDGKAIRSRRDWVIPNGIEDPRPLASRRAEGDPIRLLYVGRICESKGVLVLLEACRLLKEENLPFRLDLVGGLESESLRAVILDKIARDGLKPYVELQGERTGRDKIQFYADADIFCFPTFFEAETFGLVAVEAMAMELPVVATRWRGVPSVVREGESGFLVPVRDAPAFASALKELFRDSGLRKRLGARGREIFEANYTLESFHTKIAEVFRTLDG